MSSVLIIGAGDVGERLATGLAGREEVDRLILAGRSRERVETVAATITTAYDCFVDTDVLDATRVEDVAGLLQSSRPDLVVLSASHRSPWQLLGRDDPAAEAVAAAGLAVRLPYQLLIPLAVMRAVTDIAYDGPIANLSFPDVTGPVLATLELAPTVGLGNVGKFVLRARAAWRAAHPDGAVPLIRATGQHAQVFDVMCANPPADSCQEAVAALAPSLAEPLRIDDLGARIARLDAALDQR